jgi:ABC-type molybdate transport system permease subunit
VVRGGGGEWRWLTPYFAIVICLYLAAQSLGTSYGMDPARIIGGYAQRILVVGPIVLFVFVCGSLVWFIIRREASPIGSFLKLFQSRFSTPYEFAAVAAVVFAIPYLLGAFGLFKMALP